MGKSRCSSLLRLTSSFRQSPLSRRTLIIGSLCAVYLLVVVSQVGYSQQGRDRRTGRVEHRNTRGLYHLELGDALPDSARSRAGAGASFVAPTRSNVVYITLKSRRLKPVNIRGTIRPKLRRKVRRTRSADSAFTRGRRAAPGRDAGRVERDHSRKTPWGDTGGVDYKSLGANQTSHAGRHTDSSSSSIRIYSLRAPPWLSPQDVDTMRFLADAKVARVTEVPLGDPPSLLVFEGDAGGLATNGSRAKPGGACGGRCGVIRRPVDTAEVFAFHLDRVLGLNRTLPAVSRTFSFLHEGRPCPVASWDAALYPDGLAAGRSAVRFTWGEYQSALKQRCWHKNTSPKPDAGCSAVHHFEWSKLALFDFLLQIHNRLDPSCCGFRPRREDACVELGRHAECGDRSLTKLTNIIQRGHDPRHLVFANNKGFFDRNEDNLDFRLLEGIKEFPEEAVSVLRSMRLRERLLQSLFLDQTYWESQGGRPGIDKLIDVIERRAKVLLTYINAHGIQTVSMSE